MTDPRYPVSIRRLEPRARFEAAGARQALAQALGAAGLPLPARANCSAGVGTGARVDWLGPRRFVVTGAMADEAQLDARLTAAFAALDTALVCCVTDMVVVFELVGRGAADVLAQGTALDVSDTAFAAGGVTVTDLWGIAAVIERPVDQPDCRRVTVDSSQAGFVDAWFHEANGLACALQPGVMRTAGGAETPARPRPES